MSSCIIILLFTTLFIVCKREDVKPLDSYDILDKYKTFHIATEFIPLETICSICNAQAAIYDCYQDRRGTQGRNDIIKNCNALEKFLKNKETHDSDRSLINKIRRWNDVDYYSWKNQIYYETLTDNEKQDVDHIIQFFAHVSKNCEVYKNHKQLDSNLEPILKQ